MTTVPSTAAATGRRLTRRRVIALGAAAGLASTTRAHAAPRRFRRGVNAWPWLAMPAPDPPAGQAYPDWPPYLPGRPVPTAADLRGLASAGFDFVRLVVDPAPFLNVAAATGSGQPAKLLSLLTDAVREADACGLGVIVNLQPGGSQRWTADRLYGHGAGGPDFRLYLGLVASLAGHLARLSVARLAFEPVNEPPQDAASPAGADDWNRKQAALLRAARAAAPALTLVATGASGGGPAGLQALDGRRLAAMADPLLFTFHFYEPFLFSHQGAPWLAAAEPHYRWLNRVPWPGSNGTLQGTLAAVRARMDADRHTPAAEKSAAYALTQSVLRTYFDAAVDRSFIERFFAGVTGWTRENGLAADRILLGEFGALRSTTAALDTWDVPPQSTTGGPYVAAEAGDRARYLCDVRRTAEDHGFGWSVWTLFNPGMGILDETSRTIEPALLSALGLVPD